MLTVPTDLYSYEFGSYQIYHLIYSLIFIQFMQSVNLYN